MDKEKVLKTLKKIAVKTGIGLGVLFVIYMVNGDSRLIEVIYDALYKYHHTKPVEDKI